MSAMCRYCCKSPKLTGDNFLARRRSKSRLLIDMASDSLPKSPVSSSSGDVVPHMSTGKSRLQPGNFVISDTKRLLQHNQHPAAVRGDAARWQQWRVKRTVAERVEEGFLLCPEWFTQQSVRLSRPRHRPQCRGTCGCSDLGMAEQQLNGGHAPSISDYLAGSTKAYRAELPELHLAQRVPLILPLRMCQRRR